MTDGTPDREALDTAQNLTKGMKTLAEEVKRLRRYGHHNRWFILVDIALTVLLAVVGTVSVHAADQAANAATTASAEHSFGSAAVPEREHAPCPAGAGPGCHPRPRAAAAG